MLSLKKFYTQLLISLVIAFQASFAFGAASSDYLEGQIIKYYFQNDAAAAAKPTTLYVALATATGSDAACGTEVTGGSYARVAVTNNATNWAGPTTNDGTIKNGIAVTFPAPTANWGVVTEVCVFDASTAGNLYFRVALTTAKTINNGDAAPSFAVNALTFQVDN